VTTPDEDERLVLGAVQLILAEKRTFLALMRTGIAVFALPLATTSALIATSKYYELADVLGLFVPVMLINAGLVALGAYLVIRSARRLHHADRVLADLKRAHPTLAPYLD
jgi:hypothetical protein